MDIFVNYLVNEFDKVNVSLFQAIKHCRKNTLVYLEGEKTEREGMKNIIITKRLRKNQMK